MFEQLPEFDADYLEVSQYGKHQFDRDYVGAFFQKMLPELRQKLGAVKTGLPTQETVAYERVINFIEFYLRKSAAVPLPVDENAYKEIFSHQKISPLPEHKRWEAALVYMIMCLSNDIHAVITSVRGNKLPGDMGKPWPEEEQKKVLVKLEHRLELVDEITDNISDHYFPFSCG